jgi:hypothetical protein
MFDVTVITKTVFYKFKFFFGGGHAAAQQRAPLWVHTCCEGVM